MQDSYNKLFDEIEEEQTAKKLKEIDEANRIAFIIASDKDEDIDFSIRN